MRNRPAIPIITHEDAQLAKLPKKVQKQLLALYKIHLRLGMTYAQMLRKIAAEDLEHSAAWTAMAVSQEQLYKLQRSRSN
jgi:hypothetical protein